MHLFKNRYLFLLSLLLVSAGSLMATHNRAGEISVQQIGNCNDLTVRATITTYTKASSSAADRDSLIISWGDGSFQILARVNGFPGGPNGVPQGEFIGNDTKVNLYVAVHTYPGRARYVISMTDPNRNGSILNVNPPNSIVVPFHLQTTYTFLNSQFQGCNSTPILLQPPIDFGCVGQIFKHNPNAYDSDGDSLSYRLTVPLQGVASNVPNYFFPDQINQGPTNNINLNPVTGDFVWNTPKLEGEYNIAIMIIEYRQGIAIDTMIRDMQIYITVCDNKPPDIVAIPDICVIAGDTINFNVTATDSDVPFLQKIKLTALGGPFVVPFSPASFTVSSGFAVPPVIGVFNWATKCEHISNQAYSVVFKAEDNYLSSTSGFSNLRTVFIKVVGPPPLGLEVSAPDDKATLTWDSPYACEQIQNDYFLGFSVWRREGSNPFIPDTCETGLSGRGYTKIGFKQKTIVNGKYQFEDIKVEPGKNYCYRILAEFARKSEGGNPYNIVESIPSTEVCVQINRKLPLMTRVSVDITNTTNGEIYIEWSKPNSEGLDTIKAPPPYRYRLQRSVGTGTTNFSSVAGADFTYDAFWKANDTVFLDINSLNTTDNPYTYRLEFYTGLSQSIPLGATPVASSVYLRIKSTDEQNTLSWSEVVPWQNIKYAIFRQNPGTSLFDSIGVTSNKFYDDFSLVNGINYCYKVKAIGSYGIKDILSPLINWSQEACGIPIDTMPPCPVVLEVKNQCEEESVTAEDLINMLTWSVSANCGGQDDIVSYEIFERNGTLINLLASQDRNQAAEYLHKPLAGLKDCYFIIAIDSFGNRSLSSNEVCVEDCPLYVLPNAFTPNSDGTNELFVPRFKRFIDRIDMKIYNRWGGLVFQTTELNINWSGRDLQNKDLPEGVYYYVCDVFKPLANGKTLIEGYIELIKGNR